MTHALLSSGGRLSVVYRWNTDRFEQVLSLDGETVCNSVDGDSSQAWPPSPPIQQISVESIDGRETILGVGGAGLGHWSISVDCRDAAVLENENGEPAEPDAIHFDIACRVKGRPDFLGSRYDLTSLDKSEPAIWPIAFQPVLGGVNVEGPTVKIVPEPADDPPGKRDSGQVMTEDKTTRTYRWVFQVVIV